MTHLKIFFIGIVITLSTSIGLKAQSAVATSLRVSAERMIEAIVEEDYATYIDLVYPKVVEIFGGKDIMIKMTKTNKDAQKDSGLLLTKAMFNNSGDIQESSNDFQAIVTFDYLMSVSGLTYKGQNYLLAISNDEGENWYFVELETFDEESIKTFVPTYSSNIKFPTIEGAQLYDEGK